jgi:hypothetical protein
MTKSVLVLAVLAAAVSTSAVAKDLKQEKKAPAISVTQMTDSEMDRVTAGLIFFNGNGTLVTNPGKGNANGIGRGNGACRMC